MALFDFLRPKKKVDRVTLTNESITRIRPDGIQESVRWDDLIEVGIVTTDEGPFLDDIFWVLLSSDGKTGCSVPQGIEGEKELLHRLQALPGFEQWRRYKSRHLYLQCPVCVLEKGSGINSVFPRSQTPFGNALAEAIPLPIPLGNPTRPKATKLRGQSRSQMEFGNEEREKAASCSRGMTPREPGQQVVRATRTAPAQGPAPATLHSNPINLINPIKNSPSSVFMFLLSPRSQTPFGNALAEAIPLPIPLGKPTRSRATKLRRQLRSQMEFGNEGKAPPPSVRRLPEPKSYLIILIPSKIPLPSFIRPHVPPVKIPPATRPRQRAPSASN